LFDTSFLASHTMQRTMQAALKKQLRCDTWNGVTYVYNEYQCTLSVHPIEIKTAFTPDREGTARSWLHIEQKHPTIVLSYRREKIKKNTWHIRICERLVYGRTFSKRKWWMGDAYLLTNPVSDRIGIIHWWYRWSQGGSRRRPTCRTTARSRTHSWFPTRFSILLCPPSSSRGKTNNHHVTQHTQTQVTHNTERTRALCYSEKSRRSAMCDTLSCDTVATACEEEITWLYMYARMNRDMLCVCSSIYTHIYIYI